MSNIIHVFNGDAVVPIFAKSGIKGNHVVWREMLCDGPLDLYVGSDEFWTKRYDFFEKEVGVKKLEYIDKTQKELLKLKDLSDYKEIVLWFEFDLFCQINLIALCSFLVQNFSKTIKYSLVCTGKVKGKDKLQSLSDFSSEEYHILFKNRVPLSKLNLLFAEECWEIYVTSNYEKIKGFNFNKSAKFKYLKLAINQHLERFPNENGLSQIENKILKIIHSSALTGKEIVYKLLIWQSEKTVYGFGDLQYFMYLKWLNKYYEINESKYYLNNEGKTLINQ